MPASKQKISKETIEKEIYKTFEQFKKLKGISIIDYLKEFDVSVFGDKNYRKIKFSYENLIRLVLYQKLKGIKFHTKLTKHLRRNPKDKYRLGFSQTPDRTQIGYFVNHVLDDETRELLDYAADKIREVSEKFGIILDLKMFQSDPPKKQTKKLNEKIHIDKKTREACKQFKKHFTPFINFNLKNNTIYKKKEFVDLIVHMAHTKDFAESGSGTFRVNIEGRRMFCPKCNMLLYPNHETLKNGVEIKIFQCIHCGYKKRISPDADTLFYNMKKYPDHREIHRMFLVLFELAWGIARKNNLFDVRKKYNIAIDFTEWKFYGDKSSFMVVGKKPEVGTAKCYKFITLHVVEAGERFTLLALPVGSLDNINKDKLVRELLDYAKKRIRIKRVLVDRGFFDSKTIKVLNQYNVTYVMPCVQQYKVRELLKVAPAPSVIEGFILKDVKLNLVIMEQEGDNGKIEKRVFATNEHYESNDVGLLEHLFIVYGKRWGIESSYRVKKQSFLPKTASKNYKVRLFYFMFSVLLYNLWILADILVWLALYGYVGEDHKIYSKYFGAVFSLVDPGG